MRRICLTLLTTVFCLSAVEGGASITPAPGFEPPKSGGPPRALPGPMARPGMAFEVEHLMLTNDTADLARWAELAALGYHVVAAVPSGSGIIVLLERGGQPSRLQLPSEIEKNPAVAEALRTRIQGLQAERQQALRASAPAPAAVVAPAPVAPAVK